MKKPRTAATGPPRGRIFIWAHTIWPELGDVTHKSAIFEFVRSCPGTGSRVLFAPKQTEEGPVSDASVARTVERLTEQGIDVVRIGYPDLIGTERGRDILVERLPEVMEHGVAFCRAVYHTSPQGDVVPVAGGLDAGLPDICVKPDLSTLVPLPWEPGVAHCLG